MTIKERNILDWYDDVITAMLVIDAKFYLSQCILKDFTNDQKLYYCVEISVDTFSVWKNRIEKKQTFTNKDWKDIGLIFNNTNSLDKILLFKTDSVEIGTEIIDCRPNPFEVKKINFPFDVGQLYL